MEVRVPARRERAVLAVLALRSGSVVRPAELIDALWGDGAPRTATKTLQNYVASLRRLLGRDVIETVSGGYRLRVAAADVDACRFEQRLRDAAGAARDGDWSGVVEALSAALSLWRGDPLSDLAEQPLGAAEAARLGELRRVAVEQLADARLALGHHRELVADLEAAVAAEPLRERRWEQLMLALYRSGRQVDALRAYRHAREKLADQLGINPGPALQALELAILHHSSDLEPPAAVTVRDGHPARPSGTVTLVFADIAESTALARERGDEGYSRALREYRTAVRAQVEAHAGIEIDIEGDGIRAVFSRASDALAAARGVQESLMAGPVRVRIGVHTGEPLLVGPEYVGVDVHKAARICAAGHGGQVLVSSTTARLVRHGLPPGVSLADRGRFLFRGIEEPERIYQLVDPAMALSFPPLRASPALSHNLPSVRTSFVGRDTELKSLADLLGASRLVTIVGPGGAGKTRIAVELAARAAARFGTGASLCDLSALTDPGVIPAVVAAAFGLTDSPGTDPLDAVTRALQDVDVLLVVDNCEHMIETAALTIDHVLNRVPGLTVLATSREPLGLPDEQIWRLQPLPVPNPGATTSIVTASPAVQLFENRARLVQPSFEVNDFNAAEVADICRQLDGLPLAIELVAAHLAALPLSAISDGLESLGNDANRRSARSTRHRTLAAIVDWSYQLLADDARRLLRFLSVFANGFTLEAARQISNSDNLLPILSELVDKSLIMWDADGGRYRLLETVRAFARSRLDDAGDTQIAIHRQLLWSVDFVRSLGNYWTSRSDVEGFDLIEREFDNLRPVLEYAVTRRIPDALRLAAPLGAYCVRGKRSGATEARHWVEQLAGIPGGSPAQTGIALSWAAFASCWYHVLPTALEDSQRAVEILRAADDPQALQEALLQQATIVQYLGHRDEAMARYSELRDQAAAQGDIYSLERALNNMAQLNTDLGEYASAVEYARAALSLEYADRPMESEAVLRLTLVEALLGLGTTDTSTVNLIREAIVYNAPLRALSLLVTGMVLLAKALAPTNPENSAMLIRAAELVQTKYGAQDMLTFTEPDYASRVLDEVRDRIDEERLAQMNASVTDVTFEEATDLAIDLADQFLNGPGRARRDS
jgi:predicted ATPase/DNA-binding SARP family transcriptional activator